MGLTTAISMLAVVKASKGKWKSCCELNLHIFEKRNIGSLHFQSILVIRLNFFKVVVETR